MGPRDSQLADLTERVWQLERRAEEVEDEIEILSRSRVAESALLRRRFLEGIAAVVVLLSLAETDVDASEP